MNKKQLRISLVILGLFAVAVICIGLFSNIGGDTMSKLTDEQKDMVEALENIGSIDINSIEGFDDGVYVPKSFSNDIFKFEKEGNILRVQATGNGILQGNTEFVSAAKVLKEYEETTLYSVGGMDFTLEKEENAIDISKLSVSSMLKDAKKGNFSYRAGLFPDIITLKVVEKDVVLVNDTEFLRICNIGEEKGIQLDGLTEEDIPKPEESTSDVNTDAVEDVAVEENSTNTESTATENVETQEISDTPDTENNGTLEG